MVAVASKTGACARWRWCPCALLSRKASRSLWRPLRIPLAGDSSRGSSGGEGGFAPLLSLYACTVARLPKDINNLVPAARYTAHRPETAFLAMNKARAWRELFSVHARLQTSITGLRTGMDP